MPVVVSATSWTIERVTRPRPDECGSCWRTLIRDAGLHAMALDDAALCDGCAAEVDPLRFELLLRRRAG